ncbi:hypothetical protein DY000_02045043 [Brassica cretica]|uniref:Uncharacterized protein n=1 Tax=Brassica cretica TaxID=69181 RepID=A0ABQ7EVP0_BRACR|nr:hypothetical protein DY000_02045043 [Brassica cretica]
MEGARRGSGKERHGCHLQMKPKGKTWLPSSGAAERKDMAPHGSIHIEINQRATNLA